MIVLTDKGAYIFDTEAQARAFCDKNREPVVPKPKPIYYCPACEAVVDKPLLATDICPHCGYEEQYW